MPTTSKKPTGVTMLLNVAIVGICSAPRLQHHSR
jgi:hypothetical protein